MRTNLYNNFWTATEMNEELYKGKGKEYFTDKFGTLLKKLYISPLYFKSEMEKLGQFIFSGEEAPKKIKEVFDIFDYAKGCINSEEKEIIKSNLIDIAPICKNVHEVKMIDDLYQQIQEHETRNVNKEFKFEMSDLNSYQNEQKRAINDGIEKYYLSEIKTRSFFEDRIYVDFAKVKFVQNGSARTNVYVYQYDLINKWSNKRERIMNEVERTRIIERFDVLSKLEIPLNNIKPACQKGKRGVQALENLNLKECLRKSKYLHYRRWVEAEDFELEDLWIDIKDLYQFILKEINQEEEDEEKDKEKDKEKRKPHKDVSIKSANECKEKCMSLVDTILKIGLIQTSEKDFDFLITEASKELEDIHRQVIQKQIRISYLLQENGVQENDLDRIEQIRQYAFNATK